MAQWERITITPQLAVLQLLPVNVQFTTPLVVAGILWLSGNKQWGKSTAQTTSLPIAFTTAYVGFAHYNLTSLAEDNADMRVTLTTTTIKTYRDYSYTFLAIGKG